MIDESNHNYLKCIDCNRILADVVVTRKASDIKLNYIALCPYCDSQSNEIEVSGFVAIGSIPNVTRLIDFPQKDGKTVIKLAREVK